MKPRYKVGETVYYLELPTEHTDMLLWQVEIRKAGGEMIHGRFREHYTVYDKEFDIEFELKGSLYKPLLLARDKLQLSRMFINYRRQLNLRFTQLVQPIALG